MDTSPRAGGGATGTTPPSFRRCSKRRSSPDEATTRIWVRSWARRLRRVGTRSGIRPGEAFHGAGRDPPPLGLTVGHLELVQAQLGVLEPSADLIEIEQQPIGRRQGNRAALQRLPLAILDLAPATEFANDIITVADHRDIGEIEPTRRRVLEVEGGPPQSSLGADPHGFGESRPLGRERIADHRQTFRLGGEEIEGVKGHLDEGLADGPLARRVEPPNLVDPIVIEDDPKRLFVAIVDIDDPAANGEFAGFLHQIDAPVAGGGQPVRQSR